MSDIKDISVKDNANRDIYVLNKSIINNVFLKDFRKAFQYKKAEKLSQAVHVVLSNVRHKEGVTDKISILSLRLIEEVLSQNTQKASTTILEIVSLFSVGEASGIFAPKNAALLVREYQFLLASICEPEKGAEVSLAHIDMGVTEAPQETHTPAPVQNTQKTTTQSPSGRTDRKGQILDILRDKGAVGIKDISSEIRDCSAKTIQRELQVLIDQGVVQKEGERRWSKYSLYS